MKKSYFHKQLIYWVYIIIFAGLLGIFLYNLILTKDLFGLGNIIALAVINVLIWTKSQYIKIGVKIWAIIFIFIGSVVMLVGQLKPDIASNFANTNRLSYLFTASMVLVGFLIIGVVNKTIKIVEIEKYSKKKESYNLGILFAYILGISVFYIVALYFLGKLYNLIHPALGTYANSIWFLTMLLLVINARIFKNEEMNGGLDDEFLDYYIIGGIIAAMISFPFHFAFLCENIIMNHPSSFTFTKSLHDKIFLLIKFSWQTTLDTLTLGALSAYDIIDKDLILPKTNFTKTVVFIYKLCIGLLYLSAIFNIRKELKEIKTKTAHN